jgi:hypothetical protein
MFVLTSTTAVSPCFQSHIPVVKGVKLPAITLNASLTPVSQFVDELSALAGLPALAFNSQSPARAFVYEFDSLDGLGKREDVFEGRRLVSAVLRSVAEEADATVLVVSYSSSGGKTRTKRQAADAKEGPAADDENDYTVPLNLILWLSLALFFITLAVCSTKKPLQTFPSRSHSLSRALSLSFSLPLSFSLTPALFLTHSPALSLSFSLPLSFLSPSLPFSLSLPLSFSLSISSFVSLSLSLCLLFTYLHFFQSI